MKIKGQVNLRTMSDLSRGLIDDTAAVYVETKKGRWEFREDEDGDIVIRARETASGDPAFLSVAPHGSATIIVELRS